MTLDELLDRLRVTTKACIAADSQSLVILAFDARGGEIRLAAHNMDAAGVRTALAHVLTQLDAGKSIPMPAHDRGTETTKH